MVNLVGAEGFSGKPVYKGLENVLEMENVFVHIYGKNKTSPGRKMGHVTIISSEYNELIYKVSEIKKNLTVEAVLPHM
jgi:5-(carboxyamino)imidazole ribonucleotide synthase